MYTSKGITPKVDTGGGGGGDFTTMFSLGGAPLSTNEDMMFVNNLILPSVPVMNLDQFLDCSGSINNFLEPGSFSNSEVRLDHASVNKLGCIETKILPGTTASTDQDNFLYSFILPDPGAPTSQSWFPESNVNGFVNNNLSPIGNISIINFSENSESSDCSIQPNSFAVETTQKDTSLGVLTEHLPSQSLYSDVTSCSPQHHQQGDNSDKDFCVEGVCDNSGVCIDHEEVIDLNNETRDSKSQLESERLQNESPTISELISDMSTRSSQDDFEGFQETTGTVVDQAAPYFMHSVFTREEVTVVYDEVDGSQGRTQQVLVEEQQLNYSSLNLNYGQQEVDLDLSFFHQEDSHDSTKIDFPIHDDKDDDPDWSFSNDEDSPPKKKRKKSRASKRDTKTDKVAAKKSRNLKGSKRKNSKKRDSSGPVSPSTRSNGNCRPKIDVTSFRFKMGPHLRAASAILEMSGIKHISADIPHDVIRRFHPTDVYRTIERSVQSLAEWKVNTAEDVEPNWQQMLNNTDAISWEFKNDKTTFETSTNLEAEQDRIFYSSPFGFRNGRSNRFFSIRKEAEENGKLKETPKILTAIGSAELNATLNLQIIAKSCANTEFKKIKDDDSEVPLLMQLKRPQCAGLLYKSGKLLVIGIKSYDEFRTAARRLARMVQKIGASVRLTNLKLHFSIGWIKLPFNVNVESMMHHEYLSKFISYDSNIFPGVVIKMKDSPILCIVFNSGAVLMTEATGEAEMKSTIDKIYPTLRLFGYHHVG